MSEPLLVSLARVRLAWAELWMQIAYMMSGWALGVRFEADEEIREWEEWERKMRPDA